MRTIAIINQKGGCGKTTTAINLSAAAAHRGKRVLLIDLDPQSHCALGLSVPEASIERQIGDALVADLSRPFDFGDMAWQVGSHFDLVPSSLRLAGLESVGGALARLMDRDRRLEQVLRWVSARYDLCVIDCPPHIGLLTFNALRAAGDVLIPVETSFFALQGAEKQIRTIETVSRRVGRLPSYALLPTMFNEDVRLSREILDELRKRFPQETAPVAIRYCDALREAASFGQPIIEYAPESIARHDYEALWSWIETHRPATALFSGSAAHATDPGLDTPGHAEEEVLHGACGAQVDRAAETASTWSSRPGFGAHAGISPGGAPAVPAGSRAAELAERARLLLQRQHAAQQGRGGAFDAAGALGLAAAAGQGFAAPVAGARQWGSQVHFVQGGLSPQQRVYVAGDFNNWSPSATPMRFNLSNELFETAVSLPPGRYRYRLVVDGRWMADPHNPHREVNEAGEMNSIIEIKPLADWVAGQDGSSAARGSRVADAG